MTCGPRSRECDLAFTLCHVEASQGIEYRTCNSESSPISRVYDAR